MEHFKSWSTKIGDHYVICTPWLKLDTGIKLDVFFKWTSVIMNLIFEKPGCSVAYMADKSEFITYRAIQDMCMFLERHECITLNIAVVQQPDLFSDVDAEPELIEYNPFYDPENILAYPTKNCLTKYSYVKQSVLNKYKVDYIFDENMTNT